MRITTVFDWFSMNTQHSSKVLLLIDGHSILHRAYHAFPKTLTTSKGELTNAVYGFTRILLSVLKKFKPEYVAVSFDTAKPTFRHQEFAPYKEQRPEMEEDLSSQIGRVHEVVEALGIPIFEVDGYEADDVIGSLASQVNHTNSRELGNESTRINTLIITDDQDMLQLVSDSAKVYMPKKDKIWGRCEVEEEFGMEPEKIDDYKALRGDPSDNIPGVRGIGPKTAKELLHRFGSMEEIYRNLDKVDPKTQKLLAEAAEEAVLSKKLATIVTDVPIRLELEKCQTQEFDREKVEKIFSELEFKSLSKMLPGEEDNEQIKLL